MRTRIVGYDRAHRGRDGAMWDLAVKLDTYFLLRNTRFRPRAGDLLINWGRTDDHPAFLVPGVRIWNTPEAVRRCVDKLVCLRLLTDAEVPTVRWTTEIATAREWAERRPVYCRTNTRLSRGRGIFVAETPDQVRESPLYTRKFRAEHEYRVHVFDGRVIDVQKKRRREGTSPSHVRSYQNGYVFCRENVSPPQSVLDASVRAVSSLGLDFGAVDILAKQSGTCAVLEVNTAPGIENTTVQKYADAMLSKMRSA